MYSTNQYCDSRIYRKIDHIEFYVTSSDEIKKVSAIKGGITSQILYEQQTPVQDGLFDVRLGTVNEKQVCSTCHLSYINCPGHTSFIQLYEPFFNIAYTSDQLEPILKSICLACSKLLIVKDQLMIKNIQSNNEKIKFIREQAKSVKYCPNCNFQVPTISVNKDNTLLTYIANFGDRQWVLTPSMIYDKFKQITQEDTLLLGMTKNRPEDLLYYVVQVPPPTIRPTSRGDFGNTNEREDPLTINLLKILKNNIRLYQQQSKKNAKGQQAITVDDGQINTQDIIMKNIYVNEDNNKQLLQNDLINLFSSDNKHLRIKQKTKNTQETIGITQKHKGKSGRYRENLMGRRVDFSARGVITSGATISIEEVGVPIKIAKNLTIQEVVTPKNINRLSQAVKNGMNIYPGANVIIKDQVIDKYGNIQRIRVSLQLENIKNSTQLQYGDIVERHLLNGDYVLFNRQPTLHKPSMLGHKVKIIPTDTFQLNVAMTTPYNADFDGDEMNLFVPQTILSQIELKEIAISTKQVISPATSQTNIGLVQDGLVGMYKMTLNDVYFNKVDAMQLLLSTSKANDHQFLIDGQQQSYSCRQLISKILGPNINIDTKLCKIKNGIFYSGILNKDTVGAKKYNSIIQQTWDNEGPNAIVNLLDDMQKYTNQYIHKAGFTVGIRDVITDETIHQNIINQLDTSELSITQFITSVENNPNKLRLRIYDDTLLSNISKIQSNVSEIITKDIDKNNGFEIMKESGSKGTIDNLTLTSGIVGLQQKMNKLIPHDYNNRTLPYFTQFDDTPESRGLVKQSFIHGTEFPGFTYYTMTAIEQIIESSMKTAESGYVQKKFIKFSEDIQISYDNQVRLANKQLIQNVYQGNSGNPEKQYRYQFSIFDKNYEQLANEYLFDDDQLSRLVNFSKKDNQAQFQNILNIKKELFRQQQIKFYHEDDFLNKGFSIIINIKRILDIVQNDDNEFWKEGQLFNDPKSLIARIESLYHNSVLMNISCKENSIRQIENIMSKKIIVYALYELLSPKKVVTMGFTQKQLDRTFEMIITDYNQNICAPGTSIGILTAQSVGEPLTQMTLNSFHKTSGSAGGLVLTVGTQRLKEIINLTKDIKTPQMQIYLDDNKNNQQIAQNILSQIQHTIVDDVLQQVQVLYDPDNKYLKSDLIINLFDHQIGSKKKVSTNKRLALIENVKEHEKDQINSKRNNDTISSNSIKKLKQKEQYLIRLVFDKQQLYIKNIELIDIKLAINQQWKRLFTQNKNVPKHHKNLLAKITSTSILSSSDFVNNAVIHFRFDTSEINDELIRYLTQFIKGITIKGINGIGYKNQINKKTVSHIDSKTGNISTKQEYQILIDGSNIRDIRTIENINYNKIVTNNIREVYEIYGVEAARHVIIVQFQEAYSGKGQMISYQNASLLADIMTHQGRLITIHRTGAQQIGIDPIASATFEQPMKQMTKYCATNDIDTNQCLSTRICTGSLIKAGTGTPNIHFDFEKLRGIKNNKQIIDLNQHKQQFDIEDIIGQQAVMYEVENMDNLEDEEIEIL